MKNKINKKQTLKAYFLILNLIIATIAFSSLISADTAGENQQQNQQQAGTNQQASGDNSAFKACRDKCIDFRGGGFWGGVGEALNPGTFKNFLANVGIFFSAGLAGGTIAKLTGMKNGFKYGNYAGWLGFGTYKVFDTLFSGIRASTGTTSLFASKEFAIGLGATAGLAYLLAKYRKVTYRDVTFECLPWKAPVGGQDCEKCNLLDECSEYACKSLGQACEIVNKGTKNQKCVWKSPQDTISPQIKFLGIKGYKLVPATSGTETIRIPYMYDYKVGEGYDYEQETGLPSEKLQRPLATGVRIYPTGNVPSVSGGATGSPRRNNPSECIDAYNPFEWTIITDEASQCKMSSMQTNSTGNKYEEMSYYLGGDNSFSYNHSEKLSMPNPNDINKVASELQTNGVYTMYVRCSDANGNYNVDPFTIRFCVDMGPDTTPARIEKLDIPSGSPVRYNQSSLNVTAYLNEPIECRWDRIDKPYENMVNNIGCETSFEDDTDNDGLFKCNLNLTGIEDRKENNFFIRCLDQPNAEDQTKRNVNKQSFLYKIIGTQPLNIMGITPNDITISAGTNKIPVELEVKTDNGYKNGESVCSFYNDANNLAPANEEQYINFLTTGSNIHKQTFDLDSGEYTYYVRCIDTGGNADYSNTTFTTQTDTLAPAVVRAYKENEALKIITDEDSECSYSVANCNFEIADGIVMSSYDKRVHTADWKPGQNYYIRCNDKYNRQPDPNRCSITVKPYEIYDAETSSAISL